MINILGGLLLTFSCLLFTYFLMVLISNGEQFVSVITGITFGFVLSGVFANVWSSIINYWDLQDVVSSEFNLKPKDGETCTISGILKPFGDALISPFTRTPCVAYEFEISHSLEGGEYMAEGFDAKGAEMTPSVISGDMPEIKVCGRPIFEGFKEQSFHYGLDDELDENARHYFSSQPKEPINDDLKSELKGTASEYRYDTRGSGFKELEGRFIREMCVPVEAEAVGIGEYSSLLNGLIIGKKGRLRIIAGNIDSVRSDLSSGIWIKFVLAVILFLIYIGFFSLMYYLITKHQL